MLGAKHEPTNTYQRLDRVAVSAWRSVYVRGEFLIVLGVNAGLAIAEQCS